MMTASGVEYKVINSLPVLLTCLADFVRQVYWDLPFSKSNFSEGANCIIEILRAYNNILKSQVLECQAFFQKKISSVTGKHLALASNCARFLQQEVVPIIVPNLLLNDEYQGINMKGIIQGKIDELVTELHEHVDGINAKFVSIILE